MWQKQQWHQTLTIVKQRQVTKVYPSPEASQQAKKGFIFFICLTTIMGLINQ